MYTLFLSPKGKVITDAFLIRPKCLRIMLRNRRMIRYGLMLMQICRFSWSNIWKSIRGRKGWILLICRMRKMMRLKYMLGLIRMCRSLLVKWKMWILSQANILIFKSKKIKGTKGKNMKMVDMPILHFLILAMLNLG